MASVEAETIKPKPLPTPKDLAGAMGVHYATIYRAIQDGEIASVRVRKSIRIPWREYNRLTGEAA